MKIYSIFVIIRNTSRSILTFKKQIIAKDIFLKLFVATLNEVIIIFKSFEFTSFLKKKHHENIYFEYYTFGKFCK